MRQSREIRHTQQQTVQRLLAQDPSGELARRHAAVTRFASGIRSSQFYVTNACNIRCQGCWFFKNDMDHAMHDEKDRTVFAERIGTIIRAGRINFAWILGGEPALRLDRVKIISDQIRYPIIVTNGANAIPREGFEHAVVFVSLFGGIGIDDGLRAIRPNGSRFEGLFDMALRHYRNDARVTFHYILAIDHPGSIEATVHRIAANGNRVTFGYYASAGTLAADSVAQQRLLDEALRVAALFPDTVNTHPYFLRTLITGHSHFGSFGYETCPSISRQHPENSERIAHGLPSLPLFNAWASDAQTVNRCCTSGVCGECRDTEAVFSWLMVSRDRYLGSLDELRTWIELIETFYSQFHFSPWLVRRTEATAQLA